MNSEMLPTQDQETWKHELEGRSPREAAAHILSSLIGYSEAWSKHRAVDIAFLADALEAYAALQAKSQTVR